MLGEWIGFAYQGTEFYRLDLRSDGHDALIRMHPDESCESYSIVSWDLKLGMMTILKDKLGQDEPIEVNCVAVDRHYLKIEVRGIGRKWSRCVTLYRNEELDARLKITRRAAKKL